jgi:hypothetical protein
MYKSSIISLLLLAVPALAQTPGDLNCNGFAYEVSDAVLAVMTLNQSCSLDSIQDCLIQNSDIDSDGLNLSVGDYLSMWNFINSMPDHDFPQSPSGDTLRIASSDAYPGQTLNLSVDLITNDTLSAFEFYLVTDPQYLSIDTLIVEPGLEIREQLCQGSIFVYACSLFYFGEPILLNPGSYHLGELIVSVNSEINNPVTTSIIFSSDPSRVCYSGFANIGFFMPMLVNSTITISPTGIEEDSGVLPDQISLEAYPNPFNSSTTIFVNGITRAEIGIFNITGRKIALLTTDNGKAVWDATGYSSGIYFAKLLNRNAAKTIRLTFLK